jgi:SAM-dependent methyltransferase
VHPDFDTEYVDLLGSFDGVFALNVVEHIADDVLAIANAKKLLRKGGRLVILVPAYQMLFNEFDKALEHYRRYTEGSLKSVFQKNNFQIVHSQYFNFAAIAGWWFSGNILKKKTIPTGQMKIYNMLVPIFKIVDKIVLNKAGISVIVEGIK